MTLPPAEGSNGELLEWEPDRPTISPRTRTRVYVATLVLDVTVTLGAGLAGLLGWLPPAQAAAAGGLVLAAVNALATGLGVAYRPTRPGAPH